MINPQIFTFENPQNFHGTPCFLFASPAQHFSAPEGHRSVCPRHLRRAQSVSLGTGAKRFLERETF